MHPIAFTIKQFKLLGLTIGPLPIYSYGIMLVTAFIIGLAYAAKRGKGEKLSTDTMLDLGLWLLVFGIVFARLVWVAAHIKDFLNEPWQIANLRLGGLSWHGALLGGLIAVIWFSIKNKLSFGKLMDILAPSFALGQAIGRIGCFLNGCCYGKAAESVFAKLYKCYPFNGKHPAQLYELFLDLCVFFILLAWEKKIKFNGELYLTYLFLYSGARFIVEFYRFDPFKIWIFSLGQFTSLLVMFLSLSLIAFYRKKFS